MHRSVNNLDFFKYEEYRPFDGCKFKFEPFLVGLALMSGKNTNISLIFLKMYQKTLN